MSPSPNTTNREEEPVMALPLPVPLLCSMLLLNPRHVVAETIAKLQRGFKERPFREVDPEVKVGAGNAALEAAEGILRDIRGKDRTRISLGAVARARTAPLAAALKLRPKFDQAQDFGH